MSGMSLRRLYRSAIVIAGGALALTTACVPLAVAAQHPALGSFGSAVQPTFVGANGVTVDQGTGDVLVIDASTSTVSRYHADGTPAEFSALGSNVIDGVGPEDETKHGALAFGGPFGLQLAVDSSGGVTDGDIYVTQRFSNVVDIFSETGKHIGELTAGGGSSFEPCGVAVDDAGDVFVGSFEPGAVYKYEPSANPPTEADHTATFETVVQPCNISAGAGPTAGSLFVSSFAGPVTKIDAVTGEVNYVVAEGENNPTSSVDPSTGHVFVASGATVKDVDASGSSGPKVVNTITVGQEVEGVGVSGTTGHVYASPSRSSQERLGATGLLEYGPLQTLPPQITDESARSAAAGEAIVEARINPEGLSTTVQVEYGLTNAYGSVTAPINIGAGEGPIPVSATLVGLTPGQTYHFRFVATNAVGPSEGPDQTLTTFRNSGEAAACPNSAFRTGPAARLADCRAYEMVTPVDKNNTDIFGLFNLANQLVQHNQSATSGDSLTYTTSQGFGNTEGAPYVSQYIADRTPSGWSNRSITPPQGISRQNAGKRIDLEFQAFSADLCTSLLNHYTDPPLAPGAFLGIPNTYRRSNCGQPEYETISTVLSPLAGQEEPPNIYGLSADGRCGLFAPGLGGLYETCAGQTHVVNVLPDGTESSVAAAGTPGPSTSSQEESLRFGNYQNAISADGSRVYWTPLVAAGEGGPLYVRENARASRTEECLDPTKACTLAVSEESAKAYFWGASPSGARAIYSTQGKLFEFDLATGSSTLLADEVAGVMGVDEQADRTYFVSKESIGGKGTAGKPNLYLYDSAKEGAARFSFIGTVSEADALFGGTDSKRLGIVQPAPSHRVARLTPDGLHAVFSVYAPLTGYDNTDTVSGEADLEVFAYDATANGGAGSLKCISCNPSGQRPHGIDVNVELEPLTNPNWSAAYVPPAETSFYASRAISDDGSRIFFNSYDALLPTDTNGKEDVYEWEAPGSGPAGAQCTEASASYSPSNGGCLALVSSGESATDSEFVDASPDGRDIFFKTAASLVPQDPGLIDIYDAREGGGFPAPPGRLLACDGEGCQSPGAPPKASTPSSTSFSGPGNVKHHHKKHHHKKHHHKKHHHKKHHQRADKSKGAGR